MKRAQNRSYLFSSFIHSIHSVSQTPCHRYIFATDSFASKHVHRRNVRTSTAQPNSASISISGNPRIAYQPAIVKGRPAVLLVRLRVSNATARVSWRLSRRTQNKRDVRRFLHKSSRQPALNRPFELRFTLATRCEPSGAQQLPPRSTHAPNGSTTTLRRCLHRNSRARRGGCALPRWTRSLHIKTQMEK